MVVTENSRHQLYKRLEQVLGPEEATVLMEHLAPVGWADVATKRDLDALADRLDARFERELRQLEHRFLSRTVLLLGAFFTVQTTALTTVFQLLR